MGAAAWSGLAIGAADFVSYELGDRFRGAAESILMPAGPAGLSWFAVHVMIVTVLAVGAWMSISVAANAAQRVTNWGHLRLRVTQATAVVALAIFGLRLAHQASTALDFCLGGIVSVGIVAITLAWERRATRTRAGSGRMQLSHTAQAALLISMVIVLVGLAAIPSAYYVWARSMEQPAARDPRPNVMVLVLDTVRADGLGCYGSREAATPTIDRIASEGIRFETAFSTAPWTLPSHASMWTGLYPSEHGASWDHLHLDAEVDTLAERLAREGYLTVGITENPVTAKELGLAQGFGEYHERWKRPLVVAALDLVGRRLTNAPVREEWTASTVSTAVRWIDTHRHVNRPFFMFVNLMAAHLPNYPRQQPARHGWTAAELARIEPVNRMAERFYLEEHRLGDPELDIMREIYGQEIAFIDEQLTDLFDGLDVRGLLEDTIIVITSDHGENFGDHGLIEHQLCVYNSLVRVPLIVRYPSVLDPDTVPTAVSTVDLGRLVTALIEITTTEPGQPVSTSLVEALGHREAHVGEYGNPVRMLRESLGDDADRIDLDRFDRRLRFIIRGGFKLILGSDGDAELFDLQKDFDETSDLAAARPETVAEMSRALAEWDGMPPDRQLASPGPRLDDDMLRLLESLGYVAPRTDDSAQ